MKVKLSKYIVVSDALDDRDDIKSEKIVFSTRTGKGIKITNYVIDLMKAVQFDSIPDRLFTILMYHEIIIPEDEDELEMVVNRKLLIANDVLQRQASLLIRSDVDFDEHALQNWILSVYPSGKKAGIAISDFNILILLKTLERGFDRFDEIKHFLTGDEHLSTLNVKYELLVANNSLHALANFLPINKPAFNKLIFSFDGSGEEDISADLKNYLDTLISVIERSNYLQAFPVDCYFILNDSFSAESLMDKFKRINSYNSLKLFFHFPQKKLKNKNELIKKTELNLLTQLSRNNIKARFLSSSDITYLEDKEKSSLAGKSLPFLYDITKKLSPVSSLSPQQIIHFASPFHTPDAITFYNSEFASKIMKGESQCSACIYLPMCGGKQQKLDNTDVDCPELIRNFMKKVEYMYDFPLQ